MAAREVNITIINVSNTELRLESANLEHGEWTSYPTNIPNDGRAHNFHVDSVGFATGCDGSLYYAVPGGEIKMYFVDPYVGADRWSARCTSEHYTAQVTGTQGNYCNITYTVNNK